jgi:hypothetical protein
VPGGDKILRQLEGMVFGDESASKEPKPIEKLKTDSKKKKQKKRKKTLKKGQPMTNEKLWKKKSIFFRLPYWKDNLLRHNLDVMHIEKNVMNNFLGTLLDIKRKTKDNLEARKNLQEMSLRPTLHPLRKENGKTYMLPTCHTIALKDKINFLKVLRDVRVPDRYGPNIS